MECGGSGKVQTYNSRHDDYDVADCPGCSDCRCRYGPCENTRVKLYEFCGRHTYLGITKMHHHDDR